VECGAEPLTRVSGAVGLKQPPRCVPQGGGRTAERRYEPGIADRAEEERASQDHEGAPDEGDSRGGVRERDRLEPLDFRSDRLCRFDGRCSRECSGRGAAAALQRLEPPSDLAQLAGQLLELCLEFFGILLHGLCRSPDDRSMLDAFMSQL
jgi:hypothetical protein